MRTAVALAVLVACAATAAAAPKPHSEHAHSSAVDAVFSYTYDAASFRFGSQRLTIRRDGGVPSSTRLRRLCGYCDVQPANYFSHRSSVSLRDLDGDGEPEVVLDLFWGGAHCCWYTRISRYLPVEQAYRPLVHVWGNVGYRLRDLDGDGRPELVTKDDRFAYAFASFADSAFPVRILDYRAGRVDVVTTAYPREVRRDAALLWHQAMARGRARSNQGLVAAWAADECTLGRCAAALRTIDRSSRAGRVHGERPRAGYLRQLRRFLRRTGYL